jgi:peptide/nickel transport system permease protein
VLLTTVIGQAVPSFVAAMVLTWLFAVELHWFPAIGSGEGLAGRLRHLILPAVALALGYLAYVARIARTATRGELGREHVETARAGGLSPWQVTRRHVLRNAMIFGYALVDLVAISYLGLGADPATPDWGGIVAAGQSDILGGHPQQALYAGALIVLAVAAISIVGERIADRDHRWGRPR